MRHLLDYDVRVVLSWDADLTDVDLHVLEPTGEKAYFGNNRTVQGGWVSDDCTLGYGPEEYSLRKAKPGVYQLSADYYGSSQQDLLGPATVTATVILNYGRVTEQKYYVTVRLDTAEDQVDFATITIDEKGTRLEAVR